ncbi:MAG: tRNA (N(6)-L-threonylcarbamoyladenosine(37)-C(2))-methylthiotransferase MtaB, partial [Clostridiales bacterium]|nr:tRNA (N(6)-L-threonylcarbamoyladenosine(37)-C(2))-methylthiotransferase MtaB [Clostridiales bacterium]
MTAIQKTVAFCTLGCKVNQYDSQAMLEKFLEAGYAQVDFDQTADVYVVNTCVVTAVGEQKSRQMLRRALRQNPRAQLVAAGCLAQKDAQKLKGLGVRLV